MIDDIKSTFTAQVQTLPPAAPGRHDRYRPRTQSRWVLPAAAVAVVAASAAGWATLAGTGGGAAPVAEPPSPSTMDLLGAVTLPNGFAPVNECITEDDLVFLGELDGLSPDMIAANTDGACITFTWADDSGQSPPEDAEEVTVGGYSGWKWLVAGDPVYLVPIPASGDEPRLVVLIRTVGGHPNADELAELVTQLR